MLHTNIIPYPLIRQNSDYLKRAISHGHATKDRRLNNKLIKSQKHRHNQPYPADQRSQYVKEHITIEAAKYIPRTAHPHAMRHNTNPPTKTIKG